MSSRAGDKKATAERLDKWLSNLGYCSRAEARAWLREHQVWRLENQEPIERLLKADVHLQAHELLIDGKPLDHPKGLFLAMFKPLGRVCSHSEHEGPTVYDLLPSQWLRRKPALETLGRLDKDTSGLLLFSDDSLSSRALVHSKKGVWKRYRVLVDGPIPFHAVGAFASGEFWLEGEKKPLLAASLKLLSERGCTLEIQEGRYHQVKRMFAALGLGVIQLHRESFGPFDLTQDNLKDLQPGQWKVLDFPQA